MRKPSLFNLIPFQESYVQPKQLSLVLSSLNHREHERRHLDQYRIPRSP